MNVDEFRRKLHKSFSMSKSFQNTFADYRIIEIVERCAMKFTAVDMAIYDGVDKLYYAVVKDDKIEKIYSNRFDKINMEYFFHESENMRKYPTKDGYWWI